MPVQAVGTPSELPLVSPNSEIVPPFPTENGNDKVQMKKQLGLLEGVSIILGIIFGSGNLNGSALVNRVCINWFIGAECSSILQFESFDSSGRWTLCSVTETTYIFKINQCKSQSIKKRFPNIVL